MRNPAHDLSVVVVTYEWPAALEAVLHALCEQSDPAFEIVVADDGSGAETAGVVSTWQERFGNRLVHAHQPDEGWRLARVLNLGALSAHGHYLVFLSGDCLPRREFVRAVRRAALPGWFLAGKRLHTSPSLSQRILEKQVPAWRWSSLRWLLGSPRETLTSPRETRRPGVLLPIRDHRRPWREGQPEFTPPYDAYGFLMGMFRTDFQRVNGFDMRYEDWGEEDVDIAIRLRRIGLRCGWAGPSSTVIHLWHEPRKGDSKSNAPLLEELRSSARVEAVEGVRELASSLALAGHADSASPALG